MSSDRHSPAGDRSIADLTPLKSIVVSAGHAEYMGNAPVTLEYLWGMDDAYGEDGEALDYDSLPEKFDAKNPGVTVGDWDLGWQHIVRLSGTQESLVAYYKSLVEQLRVTPSGDDDTFDYYPSGVRYAAEIGGDLGLDIREDLLPAVTAALDEDEDYWQEVRDKTGIFDWPEG